MKALIRLTLQKIFVFVTLLPWLKKEICKSIFCVTILVFRPNYYFYTDVRKIIEIQILSFSTSCIGKSPQIFAKNCKKKLSSQPKYFTNWSPHHLYYKENTADVPFPLHASLIVFVCNVQSYIQWRDILRRYIYIY